MCFRPSTVAASITCPSCGKKVNEVLGNIPDECPFCEENLKEAKRMLAAGAPNPSAPVAPSVPVAPKAPGAPGAPSAPNAPKTPLSS